MNKRQQIRNKCNSKPIYVNRKDRKSIPGETIHPDKLNINSRNHIGDLTSDNGVIRHASVKDEEILNEEIVENLSIKLIIPNLKANENKDEQIKILKDKLAQSNAKLYECKNTCMSLRQEINKAQKIICNEVGEHVTIASLSHNHFLGGWKGRSQQIQQLQQKVTVLQNKLNDQSRISRSSSVSFEQKNIINGEKEKKLQIENLTRELKQSGIALENNKKKLEAARARIRVLENDLCLTRSKLILNNEKKSHDEQLIEALNGQLCAVESRYRDKEMEIKNQRDKLQRHCDELKNELFAVKFQVEQLRKKIGERETEINTLRSNKLTRVSESLSSVTSVHESSIDTMRSAQIKDSNEYVITSLAAEAEQERLLELITLLNRRLDKERIETDHMSELLRNETNKNTKLEKKIKLLETEGKKMSRINSGYRAKFSKSLNGILSSKEQLNSQEMHDKLELLEEECCALKTRLLTVQQDKATDLAIYKQMLENTKKIFQDACRNNTKISRGHSTVTV